ncbi:MAG: FecR domain-containing protein, partial [Chloroflexota bacterium]|nr:FecR domain-containing protein [Chloroflexota bacterium]
MGERYSLLVQIVALFTRLVGALGDVARIRLHYGPLPAPVVPPAPPIADAELLDKRGRPLRGAARAARIRAIERRRAAEPIAPPAAAGRVIVVPRIALPPFPSALAAPPLRRRLSRVRVPMLSVRALRLVTLTVTATFVFATVLGTTGIVNTRSSVALGASTTLTVISGQVSARSSDSDAFQPIVDGATLHAGMTIETGADTYAVLTYFEGSTVSLDPNTTLVIKALQANPDGSTVISMEQQLGRTWHSVTHLLKPDSKYEVQTPTATATVRGTMFDVGVEQDPQGQLVTTVQTTQGAVGTSKAPTPQEPQPKEEVLVTPGLEVSVTTAAPLPQPKPAPEPERKVTVTVGAASGVVLDPVGRANGIKDGKIVVQTPGAQVRVVNGKLTVTLPDIPDGKVATVIERKDATQREVDVQTTMTEQGQPQQTTRELVDTSQSAGAQVVSVDVGKGAGVKGTTITPQEMQVIASDVKIAEAPKLSRQVGAASVNGDQGAGSAPSGGSDQSGSDQGKRGQGGPGGPGAPGGPPSGFVPVIELPQLPALGPSGPGANGPFLGRGDQGGQRKTGDQERPGQGARGGSPRSGGQPQGGQPQGGQPQGGQPQGGQPQGGQPQGGQPQGGQPQGGQPQGGQPQGGQPQGGQPQGGQPQGGQPQGG